MKTDIRKSTERLRMLSMPDLDSFMKEHKQFILDTVSKHEGSIVKGTGDGFWLTFPSVTSASLAALDIQENLRASQIGKGDSDRLAVRIIITLGDVLHQEEDFFGDAVNLAARIEVVTPADEIYLSQAAWLALNKSEVQTSFVGDFNLNGFPEPVKVYKILHEYRSRLIKDQIIVFTDLRNSTAFSDSASIKDFEEMLIHHESLHIQMCEEFAGIIRNNTGDRYFITFSDADMAIAGLSRLCVEWEKFLIDKELTGKLPMRIGVHKGEFYLFRSMIFGREVNVAAMVSELAGRLSRPEKNCIFISGNVRSDLIGTKWENHLKRIEHPSDNLLIKLGIDVYELES
jgi:class 3 adenylate cyclase